MEQQSNQQLTFGKIAGIYSLNIQAIRIFHEQIGPLAEEYDRTVKRELNDSVQQVMPRLRELEDTELEHEANLRRLMKAIQAANKRSPNQSSLLREGALTTLLSFVEVLISELIQLYYSMYPGRLSADKTLTLKILRELDSTKVEDIEEYLASAEVNKLLYNKSLEDQLAHFTKELGVNTDPLNPELKSIVEIAQRRNLIVHNRGVVNKQYLSRVANELIEEYEIEQGKKLVVTEKYLDAAIDTVYVVGLTLAQLCWRNWDRDSTDEADEFIVTSMLHELLRDGRFELAARTAERLKGAKYATDRSKWMATVNHAIALKESGHPNAMESVLSSIDWSTSPLEFRITLHALRGEEEAFYQYLPKAVAAGEIQRWKLEDWSVFEHQRGTPRFAEALERHFPSGASENPEGGEDGG